MNRKKHEDSLLEALSDVGSTPTASTIFSLSHISLARRARAFSCGAFEKSGCFAMVLRALLARNSWCCCGFEDVFSMSEKHANHPQANHPQEEL
jgi:hypothetical protein